MNDCIKLMYFPAIVCEEFDSPIDALVSLCVAHDDAMNLVAASWMDGETDCVLTRIEGGRSVAALRTPQGCWAACNAFPDHGSPSLADAERSLSKLLKRGRCGMVGVCPGLKNA